MDAPHLRHVTLSKASRYSPGQFFDVRRVEVKCCGEWLHCGSFTNTCQCGADYNMSGQRLAPRAQWGEETGEHPLDCV